MLGECASWYTKVKLLGSQKTGNSLAGKDWRCLPRGSRSSGMRFRSISGPHAFFISGTHASLRVGVTWVGGNA